jgi:polysaccharide deacetylase family protein (PEP-CTERM system associated)
MTQTVCFTFDVEEHDRIEAAGHYVCPPPLRRVYSDRMASCTHWILDTLDQFGAKATFFVVGHIAVDHPKLIAEMTARGHEVASHSWDHRRVHRLAPAEFRADLARAKDALEQAGGRPVVGFRAPTFSITRETAWAIDELAEAGYRYYSSVFPVRHDRYGVPDAPRFPFLARGRRHTLLELPPATYGLGAVNLPAAGGGYFRLFPLGVMRAAVRQTLGRPTGLPVLYFHPWEFDPGQPRLPLGRGGMFRTYVGIGRSRGRFRKLLGRYPSEPMCVAAERLAGTELPTFALAPRAAGAI